MRKLTNWLLTYGGDRVFLGSVVFEHLFDEGKANHSKANYDNGGDLRAFGRNR